MALALFGRIVLRRDDCAAGKKYAERRAAVAKANAAGARALGTELPADQPAESYTPRQGESVASRIERFRLGDWEELFNDYLAFAERHLYPRRAMDPELAKQIRCMQDLSASAPGRGFSKLHSTDAPITDATAAANQLRPLHPSDGVLSAEAHATLRRG